MRKLLTRVFLLDIILIAVFVWLSPQKNTFAKDYQEEYVEECVMYEIIHKASGRVLDITDESYSNGAEVQIWDKFENHSNQKFMFEKDDLGWKIISLHSAKVIEVRNHSQKDGASVAQWDDVRATSQRWEIRDNGDGTVTFINMNSNKALDIMYGGTENGTKAWQYTSNNTEAQKFYLREVNVKELDYASWERKGNPNLIDTEFFSGVIRNRQEYGISELWVMPNPDVSYITKMEFLSSEKIFRILQEESLRSDFRNDLKKLVGGEFTEEVIEARLKRYGLEFLDIPFLTTLVNLLYSNNATWNDFIHTTDYDTGVLIITRTRYIVEPIMSPYSVAGIIKAQYKIVPKHSFEFYKWNEDTLMLDATINMYGMWKYIYQ